MARFDVAVVGAGPAGSTAAREVAASGARVVLLERARLPRDKTCGGGVVARAFDGLPAAAAAAVERDCREIELGFAGLDRPMRIVRPEPIVRMVMRARFDQALAEAAAAAGAAVRDGVTVGAVEQSRRGLVLAAGAERIEADFAVLAAGAQDRLAVALGFAPLPPPIPALEDEVWLAEGAPGPAACARFDLGEPPHGYAWRFPKGDHWSIGVLSTRRGASDLRARLDRYAGAGAGRIERAVVRGWTIPARPRPRPLGRARALVAGDCAGLADPVTGEGIRNAIDSGRMAARALVAARCLLGAAADYDRALAATLLPELAAARALARLLYGWPRAARALFRRHGPELAEAMADLVAGRRGYRESLTRPRNWMRLVVRPGRAGP